MGTFSSRKYHSIWDDKGGVLAFLRKHLVAGIALDKRDWAGIGCIRDGGYTGRSLLRFLRGTCTLLPLCRSLETLEYPLCFDLLHSIPAIHHTTFSSLLHAFCSTLNLRDLSIGILFCKNNQATVCVHLFDLMEPNVFVFAKRGSAGQAGWEGGYIRKWHHVRHRIKNSYSRMREGLKLGQPL
jgi:hypothetical protein